MEKTELIKLFDCIDEDKRDFVLDALDEYIFFKDQIEKLRTLPLIRVKQNNPEIQMITPAGKLIKDYSQVLDAKRATMLRELHRVSSTAADELAEKLAEFE